MSEDRSLGFVSAARVLTLGLLVALPMFAGRLQTWETLVAAEAVALCAALAVVGGLLGSRQAASRASKPDLRTTSVDRSGGGGSPAADLLLVAFFLLLGLASIRSVYLHGSLVQLLQIGSYLALIWLCRSLFRDDAWRRGAWLAIAVGGALAALLGLREYAHTAILQGDRSWRIFGSFYNPNCVAGYLLATMPAAAVLLARAGLRPIPAERLRSAVTARPGQAQRERPRFGAILAGFALALPAVALLLTASRAGILGALLGAAVFLAVRPSRISKRWLAVAALALVVLAMAAPPLRERFVEATSQSHSAVFRWYTWKGAARMIGARPVLGFGPGGFEFAYQQFAEAGFTRMAHETPLQIAAEAGVPALLALLVALGLIGKDLLSAGREGWPQGVEAAAGLAALAAVGFQNLLDYTWYVTAVGLTLAAVVGLALAAAGTEEARTEDAHRAPSRRPKAAEGKPSAGNDPGEKRRTAARAEGATTEAAARPRQAFAWLALAVSLLFLVAAGWGLRAQSLAGRGRVLLAQDRRSMAYGWLQKAARVDPLDAAIFEDMARAAIGSTVTSYDLWRAVEGRRRAIELCPLKAGNYLALAQLYESLEDFTSALVAAQRAIELGPNYPRAYVVLAHLFEHTSNHEEALSTYRRLEEVFESPVGRYQAVEQVNDYSYAYAWLALGEAATDEGKRDEAAQYFRRAQDLADEYARVKRGREEALRLLGTWDELDVAEAERLAAKARLAAEKAKRKREGRVEP